MGFKPTKHDNKQQEAKLRARQVGNDQFKIPPHQGTLNGQLIKEGEDDLYFDFSEPFYDTSKGVLYPGYEIFQDCHFLEDAPPIQNKATQNALLHHLLMITQIEDFDPSKIIALSEKMVNGWRKSLKITDPNGKISGGIEVDPSKIKAILDMKSLANEKEIRGFLGKLQYISRFISKLTMICEPVFRKLHKSEPKVWDEDCQHAFDTIKDYLSNPPVLKPAILGAPLRLYLTTTNSAVGAMLAQEIDDKENAVYYISKKLLEYETRYTQLERISIAWFGPQRNSSITCSPTQCV
ncbi:uncharacterized protein [Spinacia oleracea]|uniref:Reverse transcriptase/retrotransposon-derived protein RNase H-like domain-containing protein n=1 Tax=Spinacia oleracea TaxID=3562 RepID=A0ABM3QYF7_SPIOL|nr:uncharacterized protein LOC130463313 [Spinacia oleracea]